MKLIKRLIIITLIIAAFLAGSVYHEARQVYKQAVADTPIEEKVAQIQSIEPAAKDVCRGCNCGRGQTL